jgi:hypothetical protein
MGSGANPLPIKASAWWWWWCIQVTVRVSGSDEGHGSCDVRAIALQWAARVEMSLGVIVIQLRKAHGLQANRRGLSIRGIGPRHRCFVRLVLAHRTAPSRSARDETYEFTEYNNHFHDHSRKEMHNVNVQENH